MSSKRHLRRKQCEQKQAYPTEAAAQHAARLVEQRDHRPVHAYRCPWGAHWHAGHFNPKQQPRRPHPKHGR